MSTPDIKLEFHDGDDLSSDSIRLWGAMLERTLSDPASSQAVGGSYEELRHFVDVASERDPEVVHTLVTRMRETAATSVRDERQRLYELLPAKAVSSLEQFVHVSMRAVLLESALHLRRVHWDLPVSTYVPMLVEELGHPSKPQFRKKIRLTASHRDLRDPEEMVTAAELALRLGNLSDETVRQREKKGQLFSILRPGRKRGREYPAFQAWAEIVGHPLEEVMAALGDSRASLAYGFFLSPNVALGDLTPLEVMTGKAALPHSSSGPGKQLLDSPTDVRRAAVVEAAKALAGSAST